MFIKFRDRSGEEKTFVTRFYSDDPNIFLESDKCYIYELIGEYAEADLRVKTGFKNALAVFLDIYIGQAVIKKGRVIPIGEMKDNKIGKITE